MTECKCKYYELDEAAKKEAESMEAAYRASMSEAEWASMEEWAAQMNPNDDPLDECKNFCKHLCEGKGHPGNTFIFVTHPETHTYFTSTSMCRRLYERGKDYEKKQLEPRDAV